MELRIASLVALVSALWTAPAHADFVTIDGEPAVASVGFTIGANIMNQQLGTQPFIGVHGDYRFRHWLGFGFFVDYTSLGNSIPGMPGVAPINNGNFYIAALEVNLFPISALSGFSFGPSFGFSTYNSPDTYIQGSTNSTFWVYGARAGYDLPVLPGASVGAFVSDLVINSNGIIGFNTNTLNIGAALKWWF